MSTYEKPIVAAPLSFTGSTQRLWRPVTRQKAAAGKILLGSLVALALVFVWTLIICWYLIWGLWVVPYRLIRRGQRRQRYLEREVAQLQQGQQPWGSAKPQQKPNPWT